MKKLAMCAVSGLILLTAAGCGGGAQVTAASAASEGTGQVSANGFAANETAPLSQSTRALLAEKGTTVAVMDEKATSGAVSAQTAAESGARTFSFTHGKHPTEMSFGRVTNTVYGTTQPEDAPEGAFEPLIKDRLMWLVLFDGVDVPLLGPAPPEGAKLDAQATYSTKLLVYVDGMTGEYVRATTLSESATIGSEDGEPTKR